MPSVLVMEIAAAEKRRSYAGTLREPKASVPLGPDDIKQCLRAIRASALDQQAAFVERAVAVWSQDQAVSVAMAKDAEAAVRAIAGVGGQTRRIAINKSSVLRSELVPKLAAAGFRVMEPYYEQFQPFENRFTGYWQLPLMPVEYRQESFLITGDLARQRRERIEASDARDAIGVLGVNAAGGDGAILLMQHGRNISDIFTQCREVILVIGIDKIVADREAAIFQTRGMALYGSDAVLLDLRYKEASGESFEKLPFSIPPQSAGRRIHIILLDNGRSRLREGPYRELLLCMDCRACVRACPIGEVEWRRGEGRRSPKEYVHFRALGMNPSPRSCLQCRRCEVACPVGIPLPDLIAEVGARVGRGLPGALADYVLGNPERLLRRAGAASALYNAATSIGAFRWLGEKTMGIAKDRRPPRVHRNTFSKWFRSRSGKFSAGARDER